MKTINWSGYEWITQERWGDIHPEKPTVGMMNMLLALM